MTTTIIESFSKKVDTLNEKKRDAVRKFDTQIKAAQRALKSAQASQLADAQQELLAHLGADTVADVESLKEAFFQDTNASNAVELPSGISDTLPTDSAGSVSEGRDLVTSAASQQSHAGYYSQQDG